MEENREKNRELTEEEAAQVSGGQFYTTRYWKDKNDVEYIFEVGQEVEVASGWGFGTTVRCRITNRRVEYFRTTSPGPLGTPLVWGYRDEYFCEAIDPPFYFLGDKCWRYRGEIEM